MSARRATEPSARTATYEAVTSSVLAALESGTAPWRQPWSAGAGMPVSLSTRKPYRGINAFLLSMTGTAHGYPVPMWGTYNKIAELSGMTRDDATGKWLSPDGEPRGIRRGEKSTLVTYQNKIMVRDEDTADPSARRPVFLLKSYRVFNIAQASWPDGAPVWRDDPSRRSENEKIAAAEQIAAGYPDGPKVITGASQALYKPGPDEVEVPGLDAHDSAGEYYSTLFHELGHSTGHPGRLNRPGIAEFDHFASGQYSKEELVAEMTAALLCGTAGITGTLDNSAAYLRGWLRCLGDDSKLAVRAAGLAQRAADRILGVSWDSPEDN